jgi:hypothetical protein
VTQKAVVFFFVNFLFSWISWEPEHCNLISVNFWFSISIWLTECSVVTLLWFIVLYNFVHFINRSETQNSFSLLLEHVFCSTRTSLGICK